MAQFPEPEMLTRERMQVQLMMFFLNLLSEYGYFIFMNLSVLIRVKKNTEASLDTIDKVPAI